MCTPARDLLAIGKSGGQVALRVNARHPCAAGRWPQVSCPSRRMESRFWLVGQLARRGRGADALSRKAQHGDCNGRVFCGGRLGVDRINAARGEFVQSAHLIRECCAFWTYPGVLSFFSRFFSLSFFLSFPPPLTLRQPRIRHLQLSTRSGARPRKKLLLESGSMRASTTKNNARPRSTPSSFPFLPSLLEIIKHTGYFLFFLSHFFTRSIQKKVLPP